MIVASESGPVHAGPEVVGVRGPPGRVGRCLLAAADVLDLVTGLTVAEPYEGDVAAFGVADLLAALRGTRGDLAGDVGGPRGHGPGIGLAAPGFLGHGHDHRRGCAAGGADAGFLAEDEGHESGDADGHPHPRIVL